MCQSELLTWQLLFAAMGFIALTLAILAEPLSRRYAQVRKMAKTFWRKHGK